MKEKIHPNYVDATIVCSCGNQWQTRSTRDRVHLDVCSKCHPYFTGEARIVDTAGRVERFRMRAAKAQPRK
jgi:large subunit ribosomal protein L31